MRDESEFNEIISLLRKLWAQSDSHTVCGLIHSAISPVHFSDEIRGTADSTLLQRLRSMTFFQLERTGPPGVVAIEHVAALDEARNCDAASSYNWLNSELNRMRSIIRSGGVVRVHWDNSQPKLELSTLAQFSAWTRERYPHAIHEDPDEPPEKS